MMHNGATAMKEVSREEGFWVFQEGSGGDGVFHATREAAEKEAERLATGLAAFVLPAVRFTSEATERQRAEEARIETEVTRRHGGRRNNRDA
jgi:hypothetical protein